MAFTPMTWLDRAVQHAKRYMIKSNGGSAKNLIPPFNEGWTLHENTRMRQANFVGKVSGSTAVNPHITKASSTSSVLLAPSVFSYELATAETNRLSTLDGNLYTTTSLINGSIVQNLFSFNLIEHVIRNYGVGVFGSAITTAERVAWLKANISKLTYNWYGFGSGPAGNKAYFSRWLHTSASWQAMSNHASGTVSKLTHTETSSASISGNQLIGNDGFFHFLAYADASNGTIASTINTDFVELEIYMKEGSVPQDDYTLTLNATAATQASILDVSCLPNQQYAFNNSVNTGVTNIRTLDSNKSIISSKFSYTGVSAKTFTTESNAAYIRIEVSNVAAGNFNFANLQLELGSVATPWAPMERYEITQSPGIVTQAGTPINAANMNRLETGLQAAAGIADIAFDKVNTKILAANTNPNTVTANGKYDLTSNSANMPPAIGNRIYLEVTGYFDGQYTRQIAYEFFANRVWTRTQDGGLGWTTWTQISNETITLPQNTNLNTITEDGKYFTYNSVNAPMTGVSGYLTVSRYNDVTGYCAQQFTEWGTPMVWSRVCVNGYWSTWTPLHKTYITPSDTVILSAPTERASTGTIKSFRVKHPGIYRLKGEMRVSSGSSGFDLRFGANNAGNLTADQVPGASTSSTSYVAFSLDFVAIENGMFIVYVSGASSLYVRNVTLCGTEVFDNPNAASVLTN
ncbi:hypothetical protein BK133_11150 [Paenibacillus sp. FSL H8-0548]|uniref:pyocin knob domain-containing protein n=1 Tax=Paenibacillus sp. FSL H8-0548 TaxID=1920422 RepID=UPI00096E2458|nr:pyocin knob domain-containing protein [Paenibacillus sp. FSL H8-0548]OMF35257.1 hypothetical protein BK133_11150 [Paenibacillus sp. FSL H8-0548]